MECRAQSVPWEQKHKADIRSEDLEQQSDKSDMGDEEVRSKKKLALLETLYFMFSKAVCKHERAL